MSTTQQHNQKSRGRSQANTNTYLRTKVMTASPAELRLMLFDGAIRFCEMAKDGLAQRNIEQIYEGVTRAQAILMELINGLRPEHDPELCEKLSALYTFLYAELIEVNLERDAAKLESVLELLRYERETWSMVMGKLADANREAGEITNIPEGASASAGTGHAGGDASRIVGGRLSLQG